MAIEEIYRYPADYDLEQEAHGTADIPFWLDLLRRERPTRVLEIGCGTGRLTVPLAREGVANGFTVAGLEIEAAMLARAQDHLSSESAEVCDAVRLMQGDCRSFECKENFDVIIMPYGVAHHLTDIDEQIAREQCRLHSLDFARMAPPLEIARQINRETLPLQMRCRLGFRIRMGLNHVPVREHICHRVLPSVDSPSNFGASTRSRP